MTDYCTTFPSLAEVIVGSTFPDLKNYATAAFQSANNMVDLLPVFDVPSIPLSVPFNVVTQSSPFVAPAKPTRTIGEVVIPDEVPSIEIDAPRLDFNERAPSEPTGSGYEYRRPGGQPGSFDVEAPGDAPALDTVTMPDAPDIDGRLALIDDPDFFTITIPDAPDLLLDTIEFEGERPVIDFEVPAQTFAFTELPYSSDLLTQVKAWITQLGSGGWGLPEHITAAIYSRARGNDDMAAAKIVQEVSEEFSTRGFTEPNGILAQRLLEVRQGNQNAARATNRDLAINEAQVEIENLKTAVAQGIALEQVLISMHLAQEERRFQVARYLHESFLAVFNAQVALHNAQVAAYQADAQVYRDRLEGERTKVEAFKAEIEAQKVISEVNESLVRRYEAQVRAVMAHVEIYTARINAVRAQIEANGQRIEAYRAQVQAYGERVRAYATEWEGYRTRVQAELGSVQAADVASRNYATRVQAWGTKARVEAERVQSEIAIQALQVQGFEAQMRKFLGIVEARRTKVAADAQALAADASVYQAAGQIAQAASAAADRSNEMAIARGRTEGELYLRQGELQIRQALERSQQTLAALQTASQVLGQLASASLAALNVSAGISDSTSQSTSCATNYSLSGEIATS